MSTGFGHLSMPGLEDDEDFDYDEELEEDDFEEESDSDDQDVEGTESRQQEPTVNWEERFKSLQGQYQQTVEGFQQQLQQTQGMAQGLQAELFRQRIAELEPEDQAQAWANFQTAARNQQAMQLLQNMQQQIAEERNLVGQHAREVTAQRIAQSYQVPVETLMKFDSPEEMLEVAKLAKSRRAKKAARSRSNNQESQKRSRPQFEGGTAPGRPKKQRKAETISEAKDLFASLPTPGKR